MDERTDDDLLAATRAEPEAFAVFYRRHVEAMLAYCARRTCDAGLGGAHRHRSGQGARDRLAVWDRGPPSSRMPLVAARSRIAPGGGFGMAPLALTDERSNGSRRWRSAVIVCDNVQMYAAS